MVHWHLRSGDGYFISICPVSVDRLLSVRIEVLIDFVTLQVCGVALAVVLIFCNFRFPVMTAQERFGHFDYLGNILFMIGATGVTLALSWAGHPYAWDSAGVLVPLILGLAFLASLIYVERKAIDPVIPPTLLNNRTAFIGYTTQFLHAFLVMGIVYYLPVYFQVAKQQSPVMAGVHMFPLSFVIAPFAVFCGIIVAVTKRYKELNVLAVRLRFCIMSIRRCNTNNEQWGMNVLGFGLLTLIQADSGAGLWAGLYVTLWHTPSLPF